jgi:hypothetical protein
MTHQSSLPTRSRKVAALTLYAVGGVAALVWKLLRDDREFTSGSVPFWIIGVMPNFLPAVVLPALIFIRPQVVEYRDYLQMVLIMLVALVVYEVTQIWMPSRTFDWADLGASVTGAGVSCLLGWIVFFQWHKTGDQAAD